MINTIDNIIKDVADGHKEALKAYAELKQIELNLKEAIADVYEQAIEEARNHGEKKFETYGYTFEVRNGRATYNYSNITDWVESKQFIKELEESHKSALLLKEKGQIMVDENGEAVQPAKVTYSKDSIVVRKL
jgi:hypothetical protein